MKVKRHKIYCLLTIIIYLLKYTKGSCDLTEMPKQNDVCVATLQCDQVVSFVASSWNCIKRIQKVYDSNYDYGYQRRISRTETIYDTNYILNVELKNVDDEHDIFESVTDVNIMTNIKSFHINDGNMFTLPQNIFQLSEVTKIEISNNQLSSLDLYSFVSLTQLAEINLRNNLISTLETRTQEKSSGSSSVTIIDLSQNLLENLPNTCFSLFSDLLHLNLSHNKIRSFDILTFEGVMKLTMLDVSNNLLFEIGHSFTRFINLDEMYLQNNKLTNIADYNLSKTIKLRKLNLSSNIIDTFENNTFKCLAMLEYLDFSNNKIVTIPKNLFEDNNNLHSLIFSNNSVKLINDLAFDGKNITEFNMQGNNLTGIIGKDKFKGIHVAEFDLSHEQITSIGNETFKYMCQDLNFLNMSFNNINSISYSAFTCLEQLTVLDLSHNHIEKLNFDTSSLKNLIVLYMQYNKITTITKDVFLNLAVLKSLDLSHNEIVEIERSSFLGLANIDTLTVMHNPLVNILENNTFDGLVALKSINLSFTRTTSYKNNSFSGLPTLRHINASYGLLSSVAYNTFKETGSIEKIDFSHNLLEGFHINTTSISKVEEIYLNDNLIRHITNDTFSGLKKLRMLNLVNNNIQKLEGYALKNVIELSHLYLSSNMRMEIIGNPFENLTNLYQVNLDNVKTRFTFQNVSIENLDLHSCEISDLNTLSIFNVKNLCELNLSANKIMKIDKFSFQTLPFLIKLDLSFNRISSIQPGSFLQVGGLRQLTLFGNNLQTLQFGVFDGIKALHYVNLSSNALQSFDAKLLPVALSIALDNNDISNLNIEDFLESDIVKLSIGGNPIACKVLAELKTSNYAEKFKQVITTATLDFHSENVDGISCESASKGSRIVIPVANSTGYDIRPMFIQFTNAIVDLRSTIETVGNKTTLENSYQIKSDITKLVNSIQALVAISNQTHIISSKYFQKMENITNTTQTQLEGINKQLITLTDKTKGLRLHDYFGEVASNGKNYDIRSEMEKLLKEEIEAIRKEFGKTVLKNDPIPQAQIVEKGTTDHKVLYFIAASLGIIIVLYVINFAYGCYKRDRRLNSLHCSRRPIASEMEME